MGMDDRIFNDSKITRILFKFAIPAIISLLVAELYNMVDTVFVGRYVGTEAIGALTIAFPVQRFLISIGMLIAVGTSTLVARNLGKQDKQGLISSILNALTMVFVALITVSIITFFFRENIITTLGASTSTYPLAEKYVSIILIGGIFQSIGLVACYIMTALGNTKITLYSNTLGAIINIIIDFFLVAVFGFGIAGAAIATVISQIIAFVYAMIEFKKVKQNFNLKFSLSSIIKSLKPAIIWTIAAVGFSTFIIEISDAIVAVVLNNLLFANGGDSAIVIVGVITRVSMFMFITIIGVSSAMQPIVAYNYGKQNFKRMKETLKVGITSVTITSLVLWLILMVFAKPIIGFFLKDDLILNDAITAFRICISLLPSVGLYYVVIYYYQAIGAAKKSFILSIYRQILIFIPVVFIMVNLFGVIGAWFAYPVSDLISSITSLFFMNKALKEKFYEDEIEEKSAKRFKEKAANTI